MTKIVKKVIKAFIKAVAWCLVSIVMITMITIFTIFQSSYVRSFVTDNISSYLSKITSAKFEIGDIRFNFPCNLEFDNLYIEDYSCDTMIYSKKAEIGIKGLSIADSCLFVGKVSLDSGNVCIRKGYDNLTNLSKVFSHFKSEKPRKFDIRLDVDGLVINGFRMSYKDSTSKVSYQRNTVNMKDLYVQNIDIEINDILIDNSGVSCSVSNISLNEKSGLQIQDLNADKISLSRSSSVVENINVLVSKSYMNFDTIRFSYDSIPTTADDIDLYVGIKKGTMISMGTLDYFLKKKLHMTSNVTIDGYVKGKISDIESNLSIASNGNSLQAYVMVEGLPDFKSSEFTLDLKSLKANYKSIKTISRDILKKPLSPKATSMISSLGNIELSCQFNGKFMDFSTSGRISTACGKISFDGDMHPTDSTLNSKGTLNVYNFNIGKLLSSKKLGNVTFRTDAQTSYGHRKGFLADGRMTLDSISYGKYKFHDIIATGSLFGSLFSGNVSSLKDSNLLFTADGTCDIVLDSIPTYDFRMDLKNADLTALGVNKRDSISKLSARFKAEFNGNDIDNITGYANIDTICYINQVDTISTNGIKLNADNYSKRKHFRLSSDFVDVKLEAANSYRHLIPYFRQFTKTYLPNYDEVDNIVLSYEEEDKKHNKSDKDIISKDTLSEKDFYRVIITAKESNKFASIFLPGVAIAKGTNIDFYLNPKLNKLNLKAQSNYISKGKTFIDGLDLKLNNKDDSLILSLNTNSVDIGKFCLTKAGLKSSICNNNIDFNAYFKDTSNMADIKMHAGIGNGVNGKKHIVMNILPSKLKIDTSQWYISNQDIILDSSHIAIDSLRLYSGVQNILINGNLGISTEDTLGVSISSLDIAPASFIINPAGYDIAAIANGNVSMISLFKDKIIKGRIDLNDVVFTKEKFGNCFIESTYDQDSNRLLLNLTLDDGRKPVSGYYGLSDRILNLDTHFNNLRLCLLAPLLKGNLTHMGGTAKVDVNFKLEKGITPYLNGTASINSFTAMVDFTKVQYRIPAGDISIVKNKISGNNLTIFDEDGNTANLEGYFHSDDFRKLSYNIHVKTDRLLALNTTKLDNDDFFGKVYANGSFELKGNEQKTSISAEAWTSSNSTFNLPFSSVYTTTPDNFITFRDSIHNPRPTITQIQKRKFFNKINRAKYSTEFEASLTIHATQDVQANLEYSNSVISNLITGRGSGTLEMYINTTKDIFTLNGGLDINHGSYRLIFSIADKTFTLKRGGTIKWNGPPSEPIVDLTGIYQVHTSLRPLTGNSISSGTNVAIDCGIHLSGLFFSPQISFEITAPNATPETQSVLQNALNTEESMATQFFYLFLTNNFSSEGTNDQMSSMGTSFVSTTGFEFLSSNISSLLSTKNFTWRPTYRPKTEQSSQEFGVETQVNLLQNRMILNFEGRYSVDPKYSSRRSPFSGGGNISYNLNKSGNLSLKAFTRVIDRFDETQGLQESGMGIYFTQEFTDWEDLKKRLQTIIDGKKKKRK